MALSKNIIKQINEGFTKIRNTCRFLISNTNDFDYSKDKVEFVKLFDIDKYILGKFEKLLERIHGAYDSFEFHIVYHSLYSFCVNDLSAFYLDVIKDRLYCDAADSISRKAAQTTCFEILLGLVKVMAPILTFTAEDIYSYINFSKKESVFLEKLPQKNEKYIDEDILAKFDRIYEIRGEIYKKIEEKRIAKEVNKISECDVEIFCSKEDFSILNSVKYQLSQIFMVAETRISIGDQLKISVKKTSNKKCERCWRYLNDIGTDESHPTLCKRCLSVVLCKLESGGGN